MKVFWVVLLVLILGSVAYLALGRSGSSTRGVSANENSSAAVNTPSKPATTGAAQARATPDNNETAFFANDAEMKVQPAPAPTETPAPAVASREPEPAVAEPAPAPEEETPAEVTKAESTPSPAPAAPANNVATAPAAAPSPSTAPAEGAGAVVFGAEAKVVKNDDGTMVVDDKFQLKGEGTEASPYEITWEYLVSAQEDYQPRLGKKKLPGPLKLIDNKRVKITGFVAFPIMAEEPTEMLAMLNQWDGCCIGIPPTPYDAVEVKLSEPASNEQRLVTYGTVEGKLSVEPYLVRDWLVSLYSLEDAKMSRAQ